MSAANFCENNENTRCNLRQIFKFSPGLNQELATIKLLMSSVMVAISGAFRVHLASLLLYTNSSMLTCLAGGLIIYSVYTLDRSLDSEEDTVNRGELNGSIKEIGLAASGITFLIGSYVLERTGALAFALLPFVIGFLYSKGIKIGKFALRLKGGLGVKNLVVGFMWGASVVGVAGHSCKSMLPSFLVFTFFGVKVFINSTIDDFKDIKGDVKAGIKTLPIYLGDQKTRNFLIGMHIISHLIIGIALIKGVIAFEPLIVVCSFICGLFCISKYTNEEKYMSGKLGLSFLKDGESALIIGLRSIAYTYFI